MTRIDFEQVLLACWFHDDKEEHVQNADLSEDMFEEINRPLFRKLKEYKENKYPYDIVLARKIIGDDETKKLIQAFSQVNTLVNFKYYMAEFKKHVATQEISSAIEKGILSTDMLKEQIGNLENGIEEKPIFDFKYGLKKYSDEIDKRNLGKDNKYKIGYKNLDKLLGHVMPGYFITLGGLPGVGKTNMGLKILSYEIENGVSCLYLSSEMSFMSLLDRMVAFNSQIYSAYEIRNSESKEVVSYITGELSKLYDKPCYIVETGSFNISKIKRYINETKAKFIFIDYLQMFYLDTSDGENRASAMSEIARQLKELAIEKDVIIIALSQVNADFQLKESRGIEEKSDVVIKLEETGSDTETKQIKAYLSKNRFGNTGMVKFTFLKKNCDFRESEN